MAYPATFSSVDGTTLTPDANHAGMHNAVETTVGTTAGTNVLKNFAAGDFPARINATNVLQQALQGTINTSVLGTPTITGGQFAGSASIVAGTINNAILGTPTITGGQFAGSASLAAGTINNAVLGTPTITGGAFNSGTLGTVKINQGSDAEGDTYYRNSSGAFARLGIGSNGQYLTTNGTTPSWGASLFQTKVGSFTKDLSTTGDVGYTSVGFQPSALIIFGGLPGAPGMSWGASDSSAAEKCIDQLSTGNSDNVEAFIIFISTNGLSAYSDAVVKSYDADGFTLTWAKNGSPTGTAEFVYIAFR